VTLFFVCAFFVQLLYVAAIVGGLKRSRRNQPVPKSDGKEETPPLSIVIALHNEEESVAPLLEALAAQTHPSIEVLLVDDCSTDATGDVLQAWAKDRPGARVLSRSSPTTPNKKAALAKGIEAASHDLIAQTDADCRPLPTWAEGIAAAHAASDAPTVWIGYSPFVSGSGLLGIWSRYETWQTGALTAAAAALGHPYMAVGRNLSMPKPVYEAVRTDIRGNDLLSGDDDLFVQAVRRTGAARIRPLVEPGTFVPSPAPRRWRSWFQQKRRHVSSGRAYDRMTGFLLTLYHGSHVVLWLAPLVLGSLGIGLLSARLLFHSLVIGEATRTFGEDDLAAFFVVGEAFTALYHVALVPLGLLRPPDTWRS
jgi:glycosyltransferase involved in cell wall biosynthesis